MKVVAVCLVALILIAPAHAQRPDTVFFENLTFEEIRDLIRGGARNVIVPTGGTEDNGPHMVIGKHNYVVTYTADKIARALGNTLVAPVIAYVPEGSWLPPTGICKNRVLSPCRTTRDTPNCSKPRQTA